MVDEDHLGVLDIVAVVRAEGAERLVGHREGEGALEDLHGRDAFVLEVGALDGAAGVEVAQDHRRAIAAAGGHVVDQLLRLERLLRRPAQGAGVALAVGPRVGEGDVVEDRREVIAVDVHLDVLRQRHRRCGDHAPVPGPREDEVVLRAERVLGEDHDPALPTEGEAGVHLGGAQVSETGERLHRQARGEAGVALARLVTAAEERPDGPEAVLLSAGSAGRHPVFAARDGGAVLGHASDRVFEHRHGLRGATGRHGRRRRHVALLVLRAVDGGVQVVGERDHVGEGARDGRRDGVLVLLGPDLLEADHVRLQVGQRPGDHRSPRCLVGHEGAGETDVERVEARLGARTGLVVAAGADG